MNVYPRATLGGIIFYCLLSSLPVQSASHQASHEHLHKFNWNKIYIDSIVLQYMDCNLMRLYSLSQIISLYAHLHVRVCVCKQMQ